MIARMLELFTAYLDMYVSTTLSTSSVFYGEVTLDKFGWKNSPYQ